MKLGLYAATLAAAVKASGTVRILYPSSSDEPGLTGQTWSVVLSKKFLIEL